VKNPAKSILLTTCLSLSLSPFAHADGLSDLRSALQRYQANTPLKAQIEARTWNRKGDGNNLDERQGYASVIAEDGSRGLQVAYSRDLLNKLETEEKGKEKDPKLKTPTISALGEVNASNLRSLVSAASSVNFLMEKATFLGEKNDQFQGKPARLLSFSLNQNRLSESDRKYLKKYEGNLDIWIAADGTPLGCKAWQKISGRAYMVVSFDMKSEEEWVFGVVGDRLIALKKESKSSGAGMGEKNESKVTKTLQLLN
jgi:hypothetical protein